jgi:glycerophosphoryl diester phosphodiesterase
MTRIFAHRGFSGAFPENTMLAFREALKTGCDGIELDVQLSRDGQLVIIHDETLERTTDGKGRVVDHSLEELRRLNAGAHFPGRLGPSPIPTLAEYLELVRSEPVVTNIELKTGIVTYPGIEEKLVAELRAFGLLGRVLFSSFNHQHLLKVKELSPQSEIAFVSGSWIIDAGAYCRAHGAEYFNPRHCFLTPQNFRELEAEGRRAQAWTVNDEADMRRLAALGVDSIITNEPVRAMAALRA